MSCLDSEWHRRATAVPTNPVPGKETPRRGMEKGRAGIPVASHTAVLSRASCHPPVPPALASGPWEGRRGCLRGARPPGPAGGGGREAADGLCRAFLGWGFSLIHTVYFSDFPNTWPMPRSPWHSGVAGMLPADAGGGRQRPSGPYPHTLPPPRKDPGLGAAEVPSPDPVIQARVPGQKRGSRNSLRDI